MVRERVPQRKWVAFRQVLPGTDAGSNFVDRLEQSLDLVLAEEVL